VTSLCVRFEPPRNMSNARSGRPLAFRGWRRLHQLRWVHGHQHVHGIACVIPRQNKKIQLEARCLEPCPQGQRISAGKWGKMHVALPRCATVFDDTGLPCICLPSPDSPERNCATAWSEPTRWFSRKISLMTTSWSLPRRPRDRSPWV